MKSRRFYAITLNALQVIIVLMISSRICLTVSAQSDTLSTENNINTDSLNAALLKEHDFELNVLDARRIEDSIRKVELEEELKTLKTSDNLKKTELLKQLEKLENNEKNRLAIKKNRIDSLRNTAIGYPVIGLQNDTLFQVYAKLGASTAQERSVNVSRRIRKLYEDDFLKIDSISLSREDHTIDIVYGELIITSISESDAIWENTPMEELAEKRKNLIQQAIIKAREENSIQKLLIRIGLVALVVSFVFLVLWLIRRGYFRFIQYFTDQQARWIKALNYKDYTFLSEEQLFKIVKGLFLFFYWFVNLIVLYIALPIIFSIFPFTRGWAENLFNLIVTPLQHSFTSIWNFIPNLITIIIIYVIIRYAIKFVRYLFTEIKNEKLKLSGFHPDWAMPTFSIVRFLLYAFMFVLIFPYLPGSNSDVFRGVSVFIGVLFSLGSTSAIANLIAGLVITYMRPYKIGDRIKIGDYTGDVIEKSSLVTRLLTTKNEEITIPNATVLTGNTINYSARAQKEGLILNTTVTIGYDAPWKDVHQALIDAALQTEMIEAEPLPFVLQTSLDDFYISYQLNCYSKQPNKQAYIYSMLHQSIQDIFNERGIEIMSPHYRAERDGNDSTIPVKKKEIRPETKE